MASFEYQHSILYKGENPATAQFVPKNREKQQNRTFRHRAGAEPAFLKKELEEQERQQEQEERIKRQNALLQAQQQSRGLRAAADHLRAERHHGSSTSAPSKPPAHARQKVYGGVAQTRVTEVASRTINETVHDRIAKRQKLQAAVELDDDSDDGGGTGDEADRYTDFVQQDITRKKCYSYTFVVNSATQIPTLLVFRDEERVLIFFDRY